MSLLIYEILSSRLLAVIFNEFTAYSVIVLAMLGLSAAATLARLLIVRPRFVFSSKTIAKLSLAYLFSLAAVFLGAHFLYDWMAEFRSHTPFSVLSVAGIVFSAPYFIFGLLASAVFLIAPPEEFHRLYFSDLTGAAGGCFGVVFVLEQWGMGPAQIMMITAACAGVFFFSLNKRMRGTAAAFLLLSGLFIALSPGLFESTPMTTRFMNLNEPGLPVREVWHRWNSYTRVDYRIYEGDKGLWENQIKKIYSLGRGGGQIIARPYGSPKNKKVHLSPVLTTALSGGDKDVLVMFAGVGQDMILIDEACGGTCRIRGVELNSQMVRHARGLPELRLNEFFSKPEIDLVVKEGREFLETDHDKYDVVIYAASGGRGVRFLTAYGFLAQYLYTEEGLSAALRRLKPNGMLYIKMMNKAMLLVNLRKILDREGIERLSKSVIITRGRNIPDGGTAWNALLEKNRLLYKRGGFTAEEMDEFKKNIGDRYEIIFSPRVTHPAYRVYRDIADSPDLERVLRDIRGRENLELDSMKDDSPFFRYLLPRDFISNPLHWFQPEYIKGSLRKAMGRQTVSFFQFMLFIVALGFFLIVGPLFVVGGPKLNRINMGFLAYFLLSGAGYMFCQVALIAKFSIYLGNPARSLALVLGGMIFFTGIGSLFSDRLFQKKWLNYALAACGILLSIVFFRFFPPRAGILFSVPFLLRCLLILGLLAPFGFFSGQLFPQGLRAVSLQGNPKDVAWAWAISGMASTVASAAAISFYYLWGISTVWIAAFVCYSFIVFIHPKAG